jgi:DNA helicase-2/ATP-dependent DNA helicase PcrA
MPYRLVGGTRFYERREVKDIIAYLRLVHNPFDTVSLMRVINVPNRGIGQRTVDELMRLAMARNLPPYTALQLLAEPAEGQDERGGAAPRGAPAVFSARTKNALLGFLGLLNDLIAASQEKGVVDLLDYILEKTAYRQYIDDGTKTGEDRWDNIQELRTVAKEYEDMSPLQSLTALLEGVALASDVDTYQQDARALTLITLHAAKGLEFPIVFIVGMEEGVFPHIRSFDDPDQMEEERRLCYVGVTRAKDRLYLVRAFRRTLYGNSVPNPPSRFLKDIPPHLLRSKGGISSFGEAESTWSGARGDDPAPRPVPFVRAQERQDLLKAGDKVRHTKFGEGIVVSVTAKNGDCEVAVAFKGGAGVKRLLLSFAPLERME